MAYIPNVVGSLRILPGAHIVLVTVAGYLTVAGTVLTAVGQTAVEKEDDAVPPEDDC